MKGLECCAKWFVLCHENPEVLNPGCTSKSHWGLLKKISKYNEFLTSFFLLFLRLIKHVVGS